MSSTQKTEAEFTNAFHQFYAPLVLFAYRITDNQAAAEDIVGDCFVQLWNKRESLPEIRSWKSFLYTIVKNSSLSSLKKKRASMRHIDEMTDAAEFSENKTVLESMIFSETLSRVYEALNGLPPKCKKVMAMVYLEGKKASRVADELGIAIKTVQAHQQNGIRLLQKTMLGAFFILLALFP
jgi:RNA polymerase sigma-70 factor (family 1)